MKSIILTIAALVFLNGCAGWKHYQYNAGYRDGKEYSKKGWSAKSRYYRGFYEGFLIQNFKNANEE